MIIPQYQYNPTDFPVASALPPPQAVTPAVDNPYLLKIQVPENFLKDRVRNLNLEKFMRSSLPVYYYLLLLLPVIGWIALGCLKYSYNQYQSKAERELIRDGISREDQLKNAISVSGPLAWQYRLELARYYLLQDRFQEATEILDPIPSAKEVDRVWHTHSKHISRPEHIVLENGSHQHPQTILFSEDIVSFVPPQGGMTYTDHERMMPLQAHNFEQAFMTSLANAGVAGQRKGHYVHNAYEAWNEAYYYLERGDSGNAITDVNDHCNFSKYRFALSQHLKSAGFGYNINDTDVIGEIIHLEDLGLPADLQGKKIRLEHNFWPLNVADQA